MGDESEFHNMSTETLSMTFLGMDNSMTTVTKRFDCGANLTQVAEVVRRFLLSAGYAVESVDINSGASVFSSNDAY